MIKLFKFYILFACTALCLFGCGKEENIPEGGKEPAQNVEEIYHPIKEGMIDYENLYSS